MRLKLLLFFLLLILSSSYCLAAKWTVMVYMAADNNLADAALFDIQEMETVGSSEDVNIVVQLDINPIYTLSSDHKTHRFYIQKNSEIDFPLNTNIDSSSPQNLTDFIAWATSNYPAEHYMLVLWDHGGGWKRRGILEDDTSQSIMTIDELKNAILNSETFFDIINFDACLMGMYEVAYTLKDTGSYLVFSEETEPSDGDAYSDFLNSLVQNPNMYPINLAKEIVSSYYDFYSQRNAQYPVTKSICDLRYIDELHDKLKKFVSLSNPYLNTLFERINNAVQNTQSFQIKSYKDMYDLFFNFKTQFQNLQNSDITNIINDILNLIENRVIVFYKTYNPTLSYSLDIFDLNSLSRARGISIYFPDLSSISNEEIYQYSLLDINLEQNSWYEFIETFLEIAHNYHPIATSSGGFSWAIAWLGPYGEFPSQADVDLYIVEPCPQCEDGIDIFAPYMGVSTPNGHFSPDSINTQPYLSVETYTSNKKIYSGTYIAMAALNCYGVYSLWNMEYGYADVLFYKADASTNYDFTLASEHVLDCSNPAPSVEYWTEDTVYGILYGYYTNWWIIQVEDKRMINKPYMGIKRFLGELKNDY